MDTALSIIAIVVSVATAMAEYIRWRAEGAKVKVTASVAIVGPFEDGTSRSCLCLHVVNRGRGTTVVKGWGFADPEKRFSATTAGAWSHGPPTPVVLSPESPDVFWKLDYHEQKDRISNSHPGMPHLLQGYVILPGRRTVRSKNVVAIGNATARQMTWSERWASLRQAGIFTLIFQDASGGPLRLAVQATGPRAARNIIVDVVRDHSFGAQQIPASAEASANCRKLRKGRTLHVGVPEAARNQGLWFRVRWRSRVGHHEQRISID